ncbi:hypothetical protein [Stakelama marina]|uniref:Uncharacterized protein n=1 Tax=Stakelama marina TaxID=2826939 RepID=A0A8T4IH72_9SPHN|nr:hypothetical protein [Stakelama marina]MBR0553983.1 hypothetical protein [Stakelama marina]
MSIRTAQPARPHPFREQIRTTGSRNALRARVRKNDQDNDWKLFMLSFTAFFICFYTFLI